jgi:molybdenum cofactor guanylyltransferase
MKPLFGLILIGGKSSRMGSDKSQLNYHGKAQKDHLFELLSGFCDEVFFSCSENQNIDSEKTIIDKYNSENPIVGVLSAFDFLPKVAWLVVACDMPLVNEKVIDLLVKNRNPNKKATAFLNLETQAPDPLLTIYEPSSFQLMSDFFQKGNPSLKGFLQKNDIQIIKLTDDSFLKNINDKATFEQFTLNTSLDYNL